METTNRIIVSLTVIDSRLGLLKRVVQSIFEQTRQPDIIHIFYSREPFLYDKGIQPEQMVLIYNELQLTNLSNISLIVSETPNIGPYRKLIPALQLYKNDIIITIDDDHEHDSHFIEQFVKAYIQHKCIVCSGGKRIDLHLRDSSREHLQPTEYPWMHILPEGFGGILYHSKMFQDDFIYYDYSRLSELSMKNDDLFFRFYTFYSGIPVICIQINKNHLLIPDEHVSLFLNYNSHLSIIETLLEISNNELLSSLASLASASNIIDFKDENYNSHEITSIQNIFKDRVGTGADVKLLQYELFAKSRCDQTIDLDSLIREYLFHNESSVCGTCLLINIETDSKRYHSAVCELKKCSIPTFVHLKATYWKKRDKMIHDLQFILDFLQHYSVVPISRENPITINSFSEISDPNIFIQDGPLACLCSHVRAMIYGFLQNTDYTIICEDDIFISNTLNIQTFIKEVPGDWDVLCFNSIPLHKKYEGSLYRFTDLFHSTHFYIVRRRAMPILFQHIYPIDDQIDILLARLHDRLNIYNICDTVYQKNFSTNTQNNLFVIFKSPNYQGIRDYIAELKTLLLENCIQTMLPNSINPAMNQRILNQIMFGVIYNFIIYFTDNVFQSDIVLSDGFNKESVPTEHQRVYELIYIILHCCVKGIHIHNRTLALYLDIMHILKRFSLHAEPSMLSLGYGSSSNTYLSCKDNRVIKVYNDELRWSRDENDTIDSLFYNEISIMQRMGRFLEFDIDKKWIVMEYQGISLYDDFTLPTNWREQVQGIFHELDCHNVFYSEFNLKNMVLRDNQLSLIDFGHAEIRDCREKANNKENMDTFIRMLELFQEKCRDINTIDDKQLMYTIMMFNINHL
jgi:GR25 family glycosyltransferase involved in LPS biosynthesis